MAILLGIETATPVCSVAVWRDNKVLALVESEGEKDHSAKVNGYIQKALAEANLSLSDLDGVVVSAGPGSYTGLRIGVSTAKGLCVALDIPLLAINTLLAMAYEGLRKHPDTQQCPMIDARRMEVYALIQNEKREIIAETKPYILDESSFENFLIKKTIFMGNGMPKWKEISTNNNTFFDDEIKPSAKNIVVLGEQKFKQKLFEDIAYYEPFYLKAANAQVSKKNFLHG